MINTIDQQKCTGCGTCSKSCGLDVFRLDTNQPERSPCMVSCPAGTDIRGYQFLLQTGDTCGALRVLQQTNPFPAITGRVCFHPCETACARKHVDTAVNINGIEQFLGDEDLRRGLDEVPVLRHVAKIAVVGAGPAGLSAAWYLASMGYEVSVYEAMPEGGGMLRYAIPAYRLPAEVVRGQVNRLREMGVRFYFNTTIGAGKDITVSELRRRGYRVVILAAGTSQSKKIEIDGITLRGVRWGLEFLRDVRMDEVGPLSGTVVVVGGGDVAVDAAISARRLGAAKVVVVSLESEDALPAYPHNIEDACREGVEFLCGFGPVRVEGGSDTSGVSGLTVRPCLRVFDESGAFAPTFGEGTRVVEATSIIFAIGQAPEKHLFDAEVLTSAAGYVQTDKRTGATDNMAVFAAGDLATGPASVVQAIAGGRESAVSADRYLRGVVILGERVKERSILAEDKLPRDNIPNFPRQGRALRHADGFAELRLGFRLDEALAESVRCMTCGSKSYIAHNDDCMTCYTCELVCPANAIDVHPFKETLPRTL